MAALLVIASINGLAPQAISAITSEGFVNAACNTFDISVIVWGAWASACYLGLRTEDTRPLKPLDLAVAGLSLVLVALPSTRLSWLALALLSTYSFWTSAELSLERRSATIFFAICVPMFWGPMLLNHAGPLLLDIDAFLVGTLTGTPHGGNLVGFADGVHRMEIFPGCSSFHNISQAGLAWVALSQTLGRGLGLRDVLWCALAMSLAAAVNLGRLWFMALSYDHFETIHGPLGAEIAGGLTLILIVLTCMIGQRRELFASA
jgi:hypothetical protein